VTAVLTEYDLGPQVSVRGEAQPGFPTVPNTVTEVAGRTVLWLGPDEWLVLGGVEADYPGAAAAVDVSANRVAFEVSGPGAVDVLAQGCALDLDPAAFAVGTCAQTLLARTQAIILRPELDRFLILVRPSFAPYARAWLADALEGV
jgi:sarcosine oxidase subunit gamma